MALDLQPDQLQVGDNSEWVQHLQERLQALGHYDGYVDGTYGEKTEAAVRALQENAGHQADGRAVRETWDALVEHEQRQGIFHPAPGAQSDQYGGHDQQHDAAAQDYVGQLSPDGAHRWNGTDWEPVAAQGADHSSSAHDQTQDYVGQLSPDGAHRWNGADWEPVHPAADPTVGHHDPVGQTHAEHEAPAEMTYEAFAAEFEELAEFWSQNA